MLLSALVAATFSLPDDAKASDSAGWIVKCAFSHSAPDDPIVAPGAPGASHLHDFLGNKSTSADPSYKSMTAASTTCGTEEDTAAYWAPALYRNGVKIAPAGSYDGRKARQKIYFRKSNLDSGTPITVPPADLRLVAGNSKATSAADNPKLGSAIYWGCSDNSTGKQTKPVNCSTGIVSLHIGFPNCWNGVKDSKNDTANVVYPDNGRCPSAYPIALPRTILRLEYPVGPDSSKVTLASGPSYTLHGDFWNTWDQAALKRLTDRCLNGNVNCGTDPNP
ncbi:MAG: DUF1996 domain-containing protein [Actinomycetes bacterium]